jgi:hypothetical protein
MVLILEALRRYRRRLHTLPVEPTRKKHAPHHELGQVEHLDGAADAKAGAERLVICNVGAASGGKVVIVKRVDSSDNTVLCHVPALGKDEWFSARFLAKHAKPLASDDDEHGVGPALPLAAPLARRPPSPHALDPADHDEHPEVPRTRRRQTTPVLDV